ncbi:MAG: DNA replication/repair protein RecF [Rubricoccaceae bacterium]
MRLVTLRLRAFRAHEDSVFTPVRNVNVLWGDNGAGKTNLIEAVSVLALGRSFLGASERVMLRREAAFFELEGTFQGARRAAQTIRVFYSPEEGKRVFVNGVSQERLSALVGLVPHVVLSPADYELTAGGPAERRRFLDTVLSQSYPAYLADLVAYRRVLRQRNALLAQYRGRPPGESGLEAWNDELAQFASRIAARRRRFLEDFAPFVARAHEALGLEAQQPRARYAPSVDGDDAPGSYLDALERLARRERELRRTLAGPHLDEVVFTLDGADVRAYASQGQHRMLSLVLRLATAFFLEDFLDEAPLLLVDDLFGTLDPQRSRAVRALLASDALGQSLVTTADRRALGDDLSGGASAAALPEDARFAFYEVTNGTVRPPEVVE